MSERYGHTPTQREPSRRFPISRGGWMGIAATLVGLAYFMLPHETPEHASEHPAPPQTAIDATQPLRNQYDVVVSSAPTTAPDEISATAKRDETSAVVAQDPTPRIEIRRTDTVDAPRETQGSIEIRMSRTEPAAPERRAAAAPTGGPPVLYIHVRDEAQRRRAERMVVPLAEKGIHVAGIKVVSSGPSTRDLRYFRSDEQDEAAQVAQALREVGMGTERVRRYEGPEGAAEPRHYELWLPPARGEASEKTIP